MSRRFISLIGVIIVIATLVVGAVYYYNQQQEDGMETDTTTIQPADEEQKSVEQASQTKALKIYYVALDDNGQSGDKVGCGDSLVAVDTEKVTFTDQVKAAFEQLLADHEQNLGQSGLYNALYQSDLQFERAEVTDDTVTVYLTGELTVGGECDSPRVKGQLEQTAKTASGSENALVYIGDKTLDEALGLKS